MLHVCGTRIELSRGDSAILTFVAENAVLTENDRAVFTVRRKTGSRAALIEKIAAPDEEGKIQIPLLNEETESWKPDAYQWDIRIVIDAEIGSDGRVTGGREVATPFPPSDLIIRRVVGDV